MEKITALFKWRMFLVTSQAVLDFIFMDNKEYVMGKFYVSLILKGISDIWWALVESRCAQSAQILYLS